MFVSPSIREAPNDREDVFAFHIVDEVSADEMQEMSHYMDTQLDRHDKVSMILIFDRYRGSESGASLNWDVIKTRLKSLTKVETYALVNAPGSVARLLEVFGRLIPVDAKAFDNEAEAWAYVGSSPSEL